ncbi:MAG: DUF1080 domain-containing protein, partial [Flavobacteriaceae bacterium]|nr:DUF1080 domain-containing protein [Flavobacteriaceae bacterium]
MSKKLPWIVTIVMLFIILGCKNEAEQSEISNPEKSNDPNQEEWLSLFNGKNLDDWIIKFSGEEPGVNYNDIVQVADNTLKVVYKEGDSFKNKFGHIYYKEPFSYYKVRFKYRFTGNQALGAAEWAKKNSGIMLHSQNPETQDVNQFFPISLEFQLLGGTNSGNRPTGNLCTPGTYIEMNGEPNFDHCINSDGKTYEGEEWISVEAVVLGGEEVFHIVENDTVLRYKSPKIGGGLINQGVSQEWSAMG